MAKRSEPEKKPEKRQIKLAVREFVESLFPEGDLMSSASSALALEGLRVHEEKRRDRGEQYSSEVPVSFSISGRHTELTLYGRADGLIRSDAGIVVEEVKTHRGAGDLEGFEGREVHWAQAMAYAAILMKEEPDAQVAVQLVYVDPENAAEYSLERQSTGQALLNWLIALCARFLAAADKEEERRIGMGEAVREAGFPFERIRPGQQAMMEAVYDQAASGGFLFVSAPTGTGKTMGALFPALKALAEGKYRKLFYLTARNPVKAVAEDAVKALIASGFPIRSLTLTAKDAICPMPDGTRCLAEDCPRAAGFYDRLFGALDELPAMGHIGRSDVEALAARHDLCPHELSLCIAEACDAVICDYNCAFDPRVRIKRFFDRGGEYLLLIDEAHNLIDRGRDMFSAMLSEKTVRDWLDALPLFMTDSTRAASEAAERLLGLLNSLGGGLAASGQSEAELQELPEGIADAAREFLGCAEPLLAMGGVLENEFLDLFFMARTFLAVEEERDERYRIIARGTSDGVELHLRCLDPSKSFADTFSKVDGAVFFSATLQPFSYYVRLICSGGEPNCLSLPSPFPQENLKALILDVDTTYARREATLNMLVDCLAAFAKGRQGNYLIFFPSYAYMRKAHELFRRKHPAIFAPMQSEQMPERDRRHFLGLFDAEHDGGMAAFAVMGGIFGEGIDLIGDKLIGVAVVGTGLPQPGVERGLIQQYHDERGEPGYDYAFTIPGFIRVLQAAGRLIRSETDRGIVLLADRRFGRREYEEMMPEWWLPIAAAANAKEVELTSASFWREAE